MARPTPLVLSRFLLSLPLLLTAATPGFADRPPNVVFILADDLGYGDVACFGQEKCQIETPGFDRIAREGMRFTDAHANASVCVPTRLAVMTGTYPWRLTHRGAGGPWAFLGTRMKPGITTLGTLMRSAGYRTGYIGKWHLGTKMHTIDDKSQGLDNVDYTQPLLIGPVQYGFDESFILPGSLDMYPYAFVKNNHWVGDVTAQKGWSAFNRIGPAAADFVDTKVLDTFSTQAESFIAESAKDSENPFFLYLALTAPHTPTSPSEAFRGKSKLGIYGDFVMEADHCVTRVLNALDNHDLTDETLVIATSDHGPAPYAGRIAAATYGQLKELEKEGHHSNGPFRGYKFSIYEGGFRVPMVARYPGVIPQESTCGELVGLQDLMATLAEMIGTPLPNDAALDSLSFYSLLKDPNAKPNRRSMILDGTRGRAIRLANWKLALCPGSGAEGRYGNLPRHLDSWVKAKQHYGKTPTSHEELWAPEFVQLFDLRSDPSESNDIAADHLARIERMREVIESAINQGATRPAARPTASNHAIQPIFGVPTSIWKSEQPAKTKTNLTPIKWLETDATVTAIHGDQRVLVYNKIAPAVPEGIDPVFKRSGHIHPIFTPKGNVVTGDYPADHAHQHALFGAWVRTTHKKQKVDFWNQRAGTGNIRHDRVISMDDNPEGATLVVQLAHEKTIEDKPQIILRETLAITIRQSQNGCFVFDLDSSQKNVSNAPLKINQYHYGGMAIRGSNEWYSEEIVERIRQYQREFSDNSSISVADLEAVGHRMLTSRGDNRFTGNHTRPDWVNLSGLGRKGVSGITIMGHRDNYQSPQPVRLHPNKPYFCFAPMVLGQFQIDAGDSYRARYRFIVQDGQPNVPIIHSQWQRYRASR